MLAPASLAFGVTRPSQRLHFEGNLISTTSYAQLVCKPLHSALKNIPGLDRHVWVRTPDSLWNLLLISKHHCNNRPSSIHWASALKILVSAAVVIPDTSAELELLYYLADTHVEVSERDRPPHECWRSVDRRKGQFILPSFYNSSSNFILEDTCKW